MEAPYSKTRKNVSTKSVSVCENYSKIELVPAVHLIEVVAWSREIGQRVVLRSDVADEGLSSAVAATDLDGIRHSGIKDTVQITTRRPMRLDFYVFFFKETGHFFQD